MSSTTRMLARDRPRLTGRAAALLIVVSLLAMLALVPARAFLDQRGQIAELERRTIELEAQNDDLRLEISRLHDPAEIERLARACLGMVGPGETALVLPGSRPAASDC
ncbi:MAG: septum formation initiator family protein [Actinomycetota bacterium]